MIGQVIGQMNAGNKEEISETGIEMIIETDSEITLEMIQEEQKDMEEKILEALIIRRKEK